MRGSPVIVTGADAGYFPLAQGLIASVRDKPPGRQVCLGFLDAGCTPEQLDWVGRHVDRVRPAEWELNFPGREAAPRYVQGMLARPFLRKYFPGHDVYLWIDADAWVQDWGAVDLFLRGARERGLAVVPEFDRGSWYAYGGLPHAWAFASVQYEAAFGRDLAAELHRHAMLNAGVFALHADAPHWAAWADRVALAARREVSFHTDQMALNAAVYKDGLFERTEMLPAWCNWTCHFGLPAWDRARACLVEPYLPHTPLGIVHLTGRPKYDRARLRTTDGDAAEVSLRYRGHLLPP